MTQVIEKQSAQVSNFLRMSAQSTNGGPSWVNDMRRQGMARFDQVGFPNTKQEEWRHTSVAPIAKTAFKLAASAPGEGAREFSFGADAACEIVFINGHFSPQLSKLGQLPRGVTVRSLAQVIPTHSEVKDSLSKLASIEANPFVALNTGFIHDGAYVHLGATRSWPAQSTCCSSRPPPMNRRSRIRVCSSSPRTMSRPRSSKATSARPGDISPTP